MFCDAEVLSAHVHPAELMLCKLKNRSDTLHACPLVKGMMVSVKAHNPPASCLLHAEHAAPPLAPARQLPGPAPPAATSLCSQLLLLSWHHRNARCLLCSYNCTAVPCAFSKGKQQQHVKKKHLVLVEAQNGTQVTELSSQQGIS